MTDKERLEEIAYNVGVSLDGEKALMSSDDYDFLYNYALQQAERVQELEKEIGDLDENIAAFETLWLEEKRKNQRYKQALEEIARDRFPGASYIAKQALEGK